MGRFRGPRIDRALWFNSVCAQRLGAALRAGGACHAAHCWIGSMGELNQYVAGGFRVCGREWKVARKLATVAAGVVLLETRDGGRYAGL